MTKIKVSWYKPSGKWYADDVIEVDDSFEPAVDDIKAFIEANQNALQKSWVNGDWFVVVMAVDQPDTDTRFFERLLKYGSI